MNLSVNTQYKIVWQAAGNLSEKEKELFEVNIDLYFFYGKNYFTILTAVTMNLLATNLSPAGLRKHMKGGVKSMKEITFQEKRKRLVFIVTCTTL